MPFIDGVICEDMERDFEIVWNETFEVCEVL